MGPTAFIDSPGSAIPDGPGGMISEIITVSGMNAYLFDVNLTTAITHTFPADLDITLTSPAGTVVTITTDNGGGNDNVFNGTIWDDDAGVPASDAIYTDGATSSPLVPEEALAAFISENPNGDWTLSITDDAGADTGTLNSWALNIVALDPTSNLPVELSSFTATAQLDGSVILTWQTASETNNVGFEIEYATVTNETPTWERLDFVAGFGTTVEAQSYSYRAEGLTPGRHLFRLKQVDFDGAFEYSPEVEAEIELPGTHELSGAYPNPFNPSTTFTLTVARQQPVRIEVFDVSGKSVGVLHDGMLEAQTQHLFRFEAGSLPGGLYMYRATGETFTESKSMLLVK
jgi:subtilisin-like proprotein convertase family protein